MALTASDEDLRRVAAGQLPEPFSYTATHPVHGDLTFTGQLPVALQLAQQSIEMDNLLAEMSPGAEPRFATLILVAAIAGLNRLIELPVIREERTIDPDVPEREVITRIIYDPATEMHEQYLTAVWMAYSAWRGSFAERVDDLGESSEATTGSASNTESDAPTTSPSTTPA